MFSPQKQTFAVKKIRLYANSSFFGISWETRQGKLEFSQSSVKYLQLDLQKIPRAFFFIKVKVWTFIHPKALKMHRLGFLKPVCALKGAVQGHYRTLSTNYCLSSLKYISYCMFMTTRSFLLMVLMVKCSRNNVRHYNSAKNDCECLFRSWNDEFLCSETEI